MAWSGAWRFGPYTCRTKGLDALLRPMSWAVTSANCLDEAIAEGAAVGDPANGVLFPAVGATGEAELVQDQGEATPMNMGHSSVP